MKDRIGLPMIEDFERSGKLLPGGTIVEGTSGNTGVGLAIAAALKGYKCIFTMPDKMSQEKVRLLKAFGAEVIITPTAVPPDHPDNYVMMAKRIAGETPNAVLANQFYNPANPDAHYATTGPELWEQTSGKITHFVGAAGTGGTLTGTGRYLKEKNPKVQIVGGDPQGSILAEIWRSQGASQGESAPYKVEGIGQDKLPGTMDMTVMDEYQTVSDRDAFAMARRLTFLCDTGERYLSKLYNDEWMRENQMLDSEKATLAQLVGAKTGETPMVVSTAAGATVRQALRLMSLHDVSQLPVMDGSSCVGSVSEGVLAAKGLEDQKVLDRSVGDVMDAPFPVVEDGQPVDSVVKLVSKSNPAVLVRRHGAITGILTRSDLLHYLMAR